MSYEAYIYTYQNDSIKNCRTMFNCFIENFAENKSITFDDIFYSGVFCDNEVYIDYEHCPFKSDDEINKLKLLELLKLQIMKSEIEKPEWMTNCENDSSYSGEGYLPPTFLHLEPKDNKHSELANVILNFLNRSSILDAF